MTELAEAPGLQVMSSSNKLVQTLEGQQRLSLKAPKKSCFVFEMLTCCCSSKLVDVHGQGGRLFKVSVSNSKKYLNIKTNRGNTVGRLVETGDCCRSRFRAQDDRGSNFGYVRQDIPECCASCPVLCFPIAIWFNIAYAICDCGSGDWILESTSKKEIQRMKPRASCCSCIEDCCLDIGCDCCDAGKWFDLVDMQRKGKIGDVRVVESGCCCCTELSVELTYTDDFLPASDRAASLYLALAWLNHEVNLGSD